MTVSSAHLPNFLCFEFIHFRKMITSILLWKVRDASSERDEIVTDLFVYEVERILLSRATNPEMKEQLKLLVRSQFNRDKARDTIFHGF